MGPPTLVGVAHRPPHRQVMARTLVVGRRLARGLRMRVGGCHQARRRRTAMSTVRGSRIFGLMYRCPFTPSLPTNALDMMGTFMQQILILAGLTLPPKTFFHFVFHVLPSLPPYLNIFFLFFCCSNPCCGLRLRFKCVRSPFFRTSLRALFLRIYLRTIPPHCAYSDLRLLSSPPAIRFSPKHLQNSTTHNTRPNVRRRQGR